jgi:membrane fusion protein, heavy metal efflux system
MKNILFIIAILAFSACNKKEKAVTETAEKTEELSSVDTIRLTQDQLQLMKVELGKPERRQMQGIITANGKVTVLANDMADITALFKGRVEKINVHEGQFVKKGDVLMELISPDMINLQEDYLKAKSELHFLTQELDRQRIMAKENVGAGKNLQEVESKVFYQNTLLKSAEAKLKLAHLSPPQYDSDFETKILIKTPISGYLDHFPVSIGTTVGEGMKLAHVESFDDLHVDVALFEKDLQQIKPNQKVRIRFADPSLPEANGHVEYIGRDIDPISKTATLHVPFTPPSGKIIATDMSVVASIETDNNSALALPESAVVQEEDKFYCFTLENTKDKTLIFKKVEILLRGKNNGWLGVSDELNGKTVVLKGANILMGESKKSAMAE